MMIYWYVLGQLFVVPFLAIPRSVIAKLIILSHFSKVLRVNYTCILIVHIFVRFCVVRTVLSHMTLCPTQGISVTVLWLHLMYLQLHAGSVCGLHLCCITQPATLTQCFVDCSILSYFSHILRANYILMVHILIFYLSCTSMVATESPK